MNCIVNGKRCRYSLNEAPWCELDLDFDIVKAEGKSEVTNYSKTDGGVCGNYEPRVLS